MSGSSSPALAKSTPNAPFASFSYAYPALACRGDGRLGGPLGSTGYPPRHVLTSPRRTPGEGQLGGTCGSTVYTPRYTPRRVLVSPRLSPGTTSFVSYTPGRPSGFIPVPVPKVSAVPPEAAVRPVQRFVRVAQPQERVPSLSHEVVPVSREVTIADGTVREDLHVYSRPPPRESSVGSPTPRTAGFVQGLRTDASHAIVDIPASPMLRQRTLPGFLGQASQKPPARQSSIAVITASPCQSSDVFKAPCLAGLTGRGSLGRTYRAPAPELLSDRPPARAVGEALALRAESQRRRWRRPAPGPSTAQFQAPSASASAPAAHAPPLYGEGSDFTPAFFRLQEKLSYLAEEGTVSL
ncbi:DDX21 [Symbiodinium natans]|uniref:DDX21 protein n=1 Tax=Symbiodinium natans TaxID=878477 RepID=A0A812JZ18_9DINO|nr:DDX21 [Symbiodinium natans]